MKRSQQTRSAHIRHVGLAALASLCLAMSQATAQQSFGSPDEAAAALAAAVKSGAKPDMLKVLGADGEDIVSSGDDVADADTRSKFTSAYDARHSVKADGKRASLIVGPDDFPFPIPLVRTKTGWAFDTDEGRHEILLRRIGRNELDTIQSCLAFVDAENEYADKDHGDGVGAYAQRIVSSPGKQDGLYWKSDGNESPLGALAAEAASEGYKAGSEPQPYHGYYYRILAGQGQNAPGGALSYLIKGKMIGGFALVAWPAEYANSGVVTFIVNHAGTVYEKDLGKDTEAAAKRMMWFDPDRSWSKVEAQKP
jgi:Protein of unknown function (DUF2950)